MLTNPLDTLRYVLRQRPRGVAVEFGVAQGNTLALIAGVMPVIGFDSFAGLPSRWRDGFEAGAFACGPPTVVNARIVAGLFEDTLPGFDWPDPIGLVHIDCDLYESTVTVLNHVPIQPGTFVVFDEFHGYPGCEQHESRAWREYATRTGVEWDVVAEGPEQLAIRLR